MLRQVARASLLARGLHPKNRNNGLVTRHVYSYSLDLMISRHLILQPATLRKTNPRRRHSNYPHLNLSLSHDSATVPAIVTATATADTATTSNANTTIITNPGNTSGSPDPDPTSTTHSETASAECDMDWSEVREQEITRLESENAHLRALLGIDSSGLAEAGVPDIDTEPALIGVLFPRRLPSASGGFLSMGQRRRGNFQSVHARVP